jgi:hypothetical protein
VEEVRRQVRRRLGEDQDRPRGCRGSADGGARGARSRGKKQLTGETQEQLARAGAAIEDLQAEARAVANGAKVDDQAVRAAQETYDDAAQQVTGLC